MTLTAPRAPLFKMVGKDSRMRAESDGGRKAPWDLARCKMKKSVEQRKKRKTSDEMRIDSVVKILCIDNALTL